MDSKRIFILIVIFLFANSLAAEDTGKINWQKDSKKAFEEASRRGAPMIIDFWASWCGPCKKMDSDVWPNKSLVETSHHFVCLKVDSDKRGTINTDYRVKALPTIIITDSVGNEMARFVGYTGAASILRAMKAIPRNYSKAQKWLSLLKKDRKNLEALVMVASFYSSEGFPSISNQYFKIALKCKNAKTDLKSREMIMLSIGMNCLKMGKHKKAAKTFKQAEKQFPKGQCYEKILFGLITAQLKGGNIAAAEKSLARLTSTYPDSKAAKYAAANISKYKKRR